MLFLFFCLCTFFFVTHTLNHTYLSTCLFRLLKHTLHTPGEDEVCFIVKDPQRQIKDYLATHGSGGVTRVLGVEKLRKRYRTHEGRRELLNMYDTFLVDHRVAPMMPCLLGNAFVKAKKMPLSVNMRRDVVEGIKRALNASGLLIQQGTSMSLRVGRVGFGVEELVENVCVAMDGVARKVEGGWHDIQSVNVKTEKSPALPVYITLPTALKSRRKKSESRKAVEKNGGVEKEKVKENGKGGEAKDGKEKKVTETRKIDEDEVEVEKKVTGSEDGDKVNGKEVQVGSKSVGGKDAANIESGEEWGTIGDGGDKSEDKREGDKVEEGTTEEGEVMGKKEKRNKKGNVKNGKKGKKKQEVRAKEEAVVKELEKAGETGVEKDVADGDMIAEKADCGERKEAEIEKPKRKRKVEVEMGGAEGKENSVDDVEKNPKKVKVVKRKKQISSRLGMK